MPFVDATRYLRVQEDDLESSFSSKRKAPASPRQPSAGVSVGAGSTAGCIAGGSVAAEEDPGVGPSTPSTPLHGKRGSIAKRGGFGAASWGSVAEGDDDTEDEEDEDIAFKTSFEDIGLRPTRLQSGGAFSRLRATLGHALNRVFGDGGDSHDYTQAYISPAGAARGDVELGVRSANGRYSKHSYGHGYGYGSQESIEDTLTYEEGYDDDEDGDLSDGAGVGGFDANGNPVGAPPTFADATRPSTAGIGASSRGRRRMRHKTRRKPGSFVDIGSGGRRGRGRDRGAFLDTLATLWEYKVPILTVLTIAALLGGFAYLIGAGLISDADLEADDEYGYDDGDGTGNGDGVVESGEGEQSTTAGYGAGTAVVAAESDAAKLMRRVTAAPWEAADAVANAETLAQAQALAEGVASKLMRNRPGGWNGR